MTNEPEDVRRTYIAVDNLISVDANLIKFCAENWACVVRTYVIPLIHIKCP
jgi:hypothetical protein